jgi:hypothetical protein
LVHVTSVPAATEIVPGLKAKFSTLTAPSSPAVAVAVTSSADELHPAAAMAAAASKMGIVFMGDPFLALCM